MCTENDTEQNCDNGSMSHGCAKPTLAVLSCCSSELLCSHSGSRSAQQRIVFAIIGGIVVATTVVSCIVDVTNQASCTTLNSSEARCRKTADWYLEIVFTWYWLDANLLIVQSANILDDNVEFSAPAPLIVTFCTIQLCRFASSILVVILAVELSAAVVILDQVCAKSEDVWQLLQQFK